MDILRKSFAVWRERFEAAVLELTKRRYALMIEDHRDFMERFGWSISRSKRKIEFVDPPYKRQRPASFQFLLAHNRLHQRYN